MAAAGCRAFAAQQELRITGGAACAAVGEDCVFVGTADGAILRFGAYPATAGAGSAGAADEVEIDLALGGRQQLGARPVEQLVLLPALGVLLVLADGAVSVHDAATLERLGSLDGAKGAGALCVSEGASSSGGTCRVCVALRGSKPLRLVLYELSAPSGGGRAGAAAGGRRSLGLGSGLLRQGGGGQRWLPYKSLLTPEPALVLAWGAEEICVGYAAQYSLVHDATGDVVELLPGEAGVNPVLLHLPGCEEVLVATGRVATFVDLRSAGAAARSPLAWEAPPLALALSPPYVLALLPGHLVVTLLGDADRPHSAVQSVALRALGGAPASPRAQPPPPPLLAAGTLRAAGAGAAPGCSEAGAGLVVCCARGEATVYRQRPLAEQLADLADARRLSVALSLLARAAVPAARADRLAACACSRYCRALLRTGRPADARVALELMPQSSVRPSSVLAFFGPWLVVPDACAEQVRAAAHPLLGRDAAATDVTALLGTLEPGARLRLETQLLGYLAAVHTRLPALTGGAPQPDGRDGGYGGGDVATATSGGSNSAAAAAAAEGAALEHRALEAALLVLSARLRTEHWRLLLDLLRPASSSTAAARQGGGAAAEVAEVARALPPLRVRLRDVEGVLSALSARARDPGRPQGRRRAGAPAAAEGAAGAPVQVEGGGAEAAAAECALALACACARMAEERRALELMALPAVVALGGASRAAELLRRTADAGLFWQWLAWLARTAPTADALRALTARPARGGAAELAEPERVWAELAGAGADEAAARARVRAVAIGFAEWLLTPPDGRGLGGGGSGDGDGRGLTEDKARAGGDGLGSEEVWRTWLAQALLDEVAHALGCAPAPASPRLAAYRARLGSLLRGRAPIDGPDLLARARARGLHPEVAMLAARAGDHVGALRALAIDGGDVGAALRHCELAAGGDARAREELVLALLRELLAPPAAGEPGEAASAPGGGAAAPPTLAPARVESARLVLEACAADGWLQPETVLQQLPPSLPLAAVRELASGALRAEAAAARAARLERGLAQAEALDVRRVRAPSNRPISLASLSVSRARVRTLARSLARAHVPLSPRPSAQTRAALTREQKRSVGVEFFTSCAKCGEQLGGAAIASYPNGATVHLACLRGVLRVSRAVPRPPVAAAGTPTADSYGVGNPFG
ncbi:hypothetical protein T492DRAFT_886585 [Pavlovales sp. CCMP2436]|nr:hypothetical protein T492DRAFT_886585 [Pavlovales sp. CCMP2436]